jgi:hypothetical protein
MSQLLLKSHPTHHKKIREDVCTRAPQKINTKRTNREKPPGLINEDTLGRNAL